MVTSGQMTKALCRKWPVWPTDMEFYGTGRIDRRQLALCTVYFGSYDQKLYALNGQTGEKLWEFETGYWWNPRHQLADGTVYFGSHDKSSMQFKPYRTCCLPMANVRSEFERTGFIPIHNNLCLRCRGDTDNSSFTIDGNELKLNVPADFETKSSTTYGLKVLIS